jgi:hypothetical protein
MPVQSLVSLLSIEPVVLELLCIVVLFSFAFFTSSKTFSCSAISDLEILYSYYTIFLGLDLLPIH